MPMSNLYKQFICSSLDGKHARVRPRMRVLRQTLDLTTHGSYEGYWREADRDLPPGLLIRLIEESREPHDLTSCFVLNPLADHTRATALELLGEHYSPLPPHHQAVMEFRFSAIVTSESGNLSLFY